MDKQSEGRDHWAEPVDGTLLKVYQEAVRFLRDLPDIPEVEEPKALSDALDAFEVAHSDLADSVWLTNFKPRERALGADPTGWRGIIETLWDIIDDIDTVSDMVKSNDAAYRKHVERLQDRRWETGITTDGYTLSIPNEASVK